MIEIMLTLIVVVMGIVCLAMKTVKEYEIRGLKNQVQMRDDRIEESKDRENELRVKLRKHFDDRNKELILEHRHYAESHRRMCNLSYQVRDLNKILNDDSYEYVNARIVEKI